MKEWPIIMSGDNPRLILEGLKTQTRRLPSSANSLVDGRRWSGRGFQNLDFSHSDVFVDPGPSPAGNPGPYLHVPHRNVDAVHRVYPLWQSGDRLWVRETWCDVGINPRKVAESAKLKYKADGVDGYVWRPSIFMFREFSRITLEIVKIRVERLQDITEEDAKAEGMIGCKRGHTYPRGTMNQPDRAEYAILWESLHGQGSWETNPWVWVIEFRHVVP
jgi:hypothetical protein